MRSVETMPKVELHLHLEGAIPLAAMWQLVQQGGGDPEVPSPSALVERFEYRDFAHFIETWVWKNRFLDTYQAFEFAAEAVARHLARQRIIYAEVFFSPTDFQQHELTPAELALSIRNGLDRVEDIEVALIVDLVRDTGPEGARRTFDQVREVAAEAQVIGVGIGGSEAEFPPELFAGVYRRAREAGFRITAHAGEAAGPASVWGAIRSLEVERIGHGIRAVEDPDLMSYLVDQEIALEVCPTSNLRTGVVSGWAHHPLRELVEAGAKVTVNTDDPAMFGCTLAGEYAVLHERFGFDDPVLRRIALNAVDACWASPRQRRRLRAEIEGWWEQAPEHGPGSGAAGRC